jgi:hypothetical protein
MTLVPFTDCCLLLGVDPKTLRLWLTSARLPCTVHPTDARLKCLTPSQLHHLADLHGRFLPDPLPGATYLPGSAPASTPVTSPLDRRADSTAGVPSPDADLRQQLTLLQAQVTTLQQQVTELALALLRSHPSAWTQHAAPPPTPLPTSLASSPPVPQPSVASPSRRVTAPVIPRASAEPDLPRSRSRALPLIEYGTDGRYVIIAPTQGVLALVPDSPEWFDWLSSLTAFTFQGKHGRFCATRKFRHGQRIQSWNVHRSLHGRSCNLYLGLTPTLTLVHLEDMAAAVQARLTTL